MSKPANNRVWICYGPFLTMLILQSADAAQVVPLDSPFTQSDQPLVGHVPVEDLNDDVQRDMVVAIPGQIIVCSPIRSIGSIKLSGHLKR